MVVEAVKEPLKILMKNISALSINSTSLTIKNKTKNFKNYAEIQKTPPAN